MASRKKKSSPESYVRCFEVTDPTLHQKGHTIYKVTQKTIRVDLPDEDFKEVFVWRRYNDFKKLYKAMHKLHQALHRREVFPPFSEAKVFGRFEAAVIQERMLYAQDLLNFLGQRHYLVNTKAFQQFFEGAEMVEHTENILQPAKVPGARDVLLPEKLGEADVKAELLAAPSETGSGQESALRAVADDEISRDSIEDGLGGIWRFRQMAEEISLGGDDSDEHTDFTDDSALSTPLPDADVSFFDPLKLPESIKEDCEVPDSNLLLLSGIGNAAVNEGGEDGVVKATKGSEEEEEMRQLEEEFAACAVLGDNIEQTGDSGVAGSSDDRLLSLDQTDAATSPDNGPTQQELLLDLSLDSDSATTCSDNGSAGYVRPDLTRQRSKPGSVIASGKGDLALSPMHPQPPPLPLSSLSSDFNRPLHSLTSTPSSSPRHGTREGSLSSSTNGSPQSLRSPARSGLVNLNMKEKADYIFMAANQISLAQQCEVSANYNMAFTYYKSAVGILLTGVQKDENKTRRDLVRRKTARYLLKAEELFHKFLNSREQGFHDRWDTGKPSPAKELDPTIAFLQGSINELKNFKVLGVVGRVLLVMDTVSETTYIIKTLSKSSSLQSRRNVIPVHLPFVVKLQRFYETDSSIYLLLQHATGGRLWCYVSGYLHHGANQEGDLDDLLGDDHERKLRTRSSTCDSDGTLVPTNSDVPASLQGKATGAERKLDPQFMHESEKSENSENDPSPDGETSYTRLFTMDAGDVDGDGDGEDGSQKTLGAKVTFHKQSDPPATSKTRVSQLHRQDSDFLSMDGSHDSSALHRALHDGNPAATSQVHRPSLDGGFHLREESSAAYFEEILEGAKVQPSLEQFSINSYDSDSELSGLGSSSRFDSTTSENIQSIPEVSEVSPLESPLHSIAGNLVHGSQLGEESAPGGEVFMADMQLTDVLTNNHSELIIQSAKTAVNVAEEELRSIVDSEEVISSDQPSKESIALDTDFEEHAGDGKTVSNAQGNGATSEEPSIYDKYKGNDSVSSQSNESVSSSPYITSLPALGCDDDPSGELPPDDEDLQEMICDSGRELSDADLLGIGHTHTHAGAANARSTKPHVFRQLSQERSVDLDLKPRNRTLSSAFGSVDIGEEKSPRSVRIPEGCVRQWAAEIVTAVDSLHAMGLVCRDLCPDNILLGERGHILLSYFSQWSCVDDELNDEVIHQQYTAPELLGVYHTDKSCDWWSLGALLYELLTGKTFSSCHLCGMTSHSQVTISDDLSQEAHSLLQKLLKYNPQERLGAGVGGVDDIKSHPFFEGVDWTTLQAGLIDQ